MTVPNPAFISNCLREKGEKDYACEIFVDHFLVSQEIKNAHSGVQIMKSVTSRPLAKPMPKLPLIKTMVYTPLPSCINLMESQLPEGYQNGSIREISYLLYIRISWENQKGKQMSG